MIVKNISLKSSRATGNLINYIFKEKVNEKERISEREPVKPILIASHNLKGTTLEEYIREFKENEENRIRKCSNQITINHCILSFSPLDKENVSIEAVKAITEKFFELRGMGNLFLAAAHMEENIHVHIAYGATVASKSNRISRSEFRQLKVDITNFQMEKFKSLKNSLPNHEKGKSKTPEKIIKNAERETVKGSLLKALESIQPKSTEQLLAHLRASGFEPYCRSGKDITGFRHIDSSLRFRASRLEIDLEKLKLLDIQTAKIEKGMAELQEIRSSRTRTIERDILKQQETRQLKDEQITRELQSIQEIRELAQGDRVKDIEREDTIREQEPEQMHIDFETPFEADQDEDSANRHKEDTEEDIGDGQMHLPFPDEEPQV